MKNILMIATGGTIASKEGDLGLTPAVTGEELAASVPGIKDICHLEIRDLGPLRARRRAAHEHRQHQYASTSMADDP